MASPHNRVSILNQCTMDPHIGGFLEPFIGDNKSFDFQHDENHRNSNEKATKIIPEFSFSSLILGLHQNRIAV